MWLERFLKLIDRSRFGVAIKKRRQLLEYGDTPGRIYVENVRAFLGIPHRAARALCDLAVRQGLFDRCTAIMCPHDERVLLEMCDPEGGAEPVTLSCEVCEALEIEPFEFKLRDCRAMPFYRVHGYASGDNA